MFKCTKFVFKLILHLHKILGTGFPEQSNRRLTFSNVYIIFIAIAILIVEIRVYIMDEISIGKKSEFFGIIIHIHRMMDIAMLSITLLLEATVNLSKKRKVYANYQKIQTMLKISQNDTLIKKCIIFHAYGFMNILFNRLWRLFSKFDLGILLHLFYTFFKFLSEEFLFMGIMCEVYYCIFCFRTLNKKLYHIKKNQKHSIKLKGKWKDQVIHLMRTYTILEDNVKFISKRAQIMVIS